jgi:L-ascorbate metabolism protein UlaG (beta-lactamase superfamily)
MIMKIQLIRSATLKINYADQIILVDPMLSPKHTFEAMVGIERNPTVDLTLPVENILKDIDFVLVTHTHPDHFDTVAIEKLPKEIKLFCQPCDQEFMKTEGFVNAEAVETETLLDRISIIRTGGKHGSGEILNYMGEVSGFILKAPNEPTIYIVGDSILVEEVENAIELYNPEIIITNSGGAIIPGFEQHPVLMDEEQTILLLKRTESAKVIAVHMESLDHCRVTKASLREKANEQGIPEDRLIIPVDGQTINL